MAGQTATPITSAGARTLLHGGVPGGERVGSSFPWPSVVAGVLLVGSIGALWYWHYRRRSTWVEEG